MGSAAGDESKFERVMRYNGLLVALLISSLQQDRPTLVCFLPTCHLLWQSCDPVSLCQHQCEAGESSQCIPVHPLISQATATQSQRLEAGQAAGKGGGQGSEAGVGTQVKGLGGGG